MPKTCSCGYGAPQANPREMLVTQGPELVVDIGFDPNFKGPGQPANLGGKGLHALVDTGAFQSCIDADLAKKLQLPVVDQQAVSGSNGKHVVNMHLGHIWIPSLGLAISGSFAGVHLVAGGQRHSALIGRTFLMHFKMTYDGLTGAVELTLP